MAQIENMFNRTCLSLGSNALLPCRSGSLPHYQKHDLFFGKLPKIAGWQRAIPRTAKTSFFGYPRNPRLTPFCSAIRLPPNQRDNSTLNSQVKALARIIITSVFSSHIGPSVLDQ